MHNRPVYLNLFRLHLPLPGWISIFHRVSGVVLFLALPAGLYLLQLSLSGETDFGRVKNLLAQLPVKLALLAVIASLAFHAFAGLRHLALDLHCGVGKAQARVSAVAVIAASILATLLSAWGLYR